MIRLAWDRHFYFHLSERIVHDVYRTWFRGLCGVCKRCTRTGLQSSIFDGFEENRSLTAPTVCDCACTAYCHHARVPCHRPKPKTRPTLKSVTCSRMSADHAHAASHVLSCGRRREVRGEGDAHQLPHILIASMRYRGSHRGPLRRVRDGLPSSFRFVSFRFV